jgi:RNA polymerase sigma-70 factor (ECF subfamily)
MASPLRLDDDIRSARHDRLALERLLAHYGPFLRLTAEQSIGAALRRREDASDIVQRTLVEAAAAIEQFHGHTEPEFSAWIRQILRRNVANAVRDHHAEKRDVRRERYVVDDGEPSAMISWRLPAADQTSPSLRLIKAEAALNLARSLERLPDDQRQAVSMRHLEGLALAKIAEAMKKTPAAVAGLIRRGVAALRLELADDSL